jgi:ribosome maturation factor RimP
MQEVAQRPPFLLAEWNEVQTVEQKLTAMLTPSLDAMGLELVQLRLLDGGRKRILQILLENAQTGRITLDECAEASRTISALLDVEDAISSAFTLEVSSPGIDRPLVKEADFVKYSGFEAKIETQLPIAGRRRFKGQLVPTEQAGQVAIVVDGQTHQIAHNNIASAKLVFTDALLKAHQDGVFQPQSTNQTPIKEKQ